MINKNLFEMREKVKTELKHIPKGSLYQNMLRQAYTSLRMNSLGKKAQYPDDKNIVLEKSIEGIRNWASERGDKFVPEFNKNFFQMKDTGE